MYLTFSSSEFSPWLASTKAEIVEWKGMAEDRGSLQEPGNRKRGGLGIGKHLSR